MLFMNYEQIKPLLTDNETEGEQYESYAVKHGHVIFLRSQRTGKWCNANYFQILYDEGIDEPAVICVQLDGYEDPNNYKWPELEEFNARVYQELSSIEE